MKVGFISLGCSKNLIDTEMGISIFKDNKFEIVSDPKEAEIIVVNTCGFIASAKEEAINTILEMAEYKNENCKYLIAMGCLVKRYKEELEKEIPEVDLWISIDEYKDFWKKVSTLIGKKVDKKVSNAGEITVYSKDAFEYYPDKAKITIYDSKGNKLDTTTVTLAENSEPQSFDFSSDSRPRKEDPKYASNGAKFIGYAGDGSWANYYKDGHYYDVDGEQID